MTLLSEKIVNYRRVNNTGMNRKKYASDINREQFAEIELLLRRAVSAAHGLSMEVPAQRFPQMADGVCLLA